MEITVTKSFLEKPAKTKKPCLHVQRKLCLSSSIADTKLLLCLIVALAWKNLVLQSPDFTFSLSHTASSKFSPA
jgi:hypothetical protein